MSAEEDRREAAGARQVGQRGKYGAVSESLLVDLMADCVAIAVINGPLGNGFAISEAQSWRDRESLARMFEAIAADLRKRPPNG